MSDMPPPSGQAFHPPIGWGSSGLSRASQQLEHHLLVTPLDPTWLVYRMVDCKLNITRPFCNLLSTIDEYWLSKGWIGERSLKSINVNSDLSGTRSSSCAFLTLLLAKTTISVLHTPDASASSEVLDNVQSWEPPTVRTSTTVRFAQYSSSNRSSSCHSHVPCRSTLYLPGPFTVHALIMLCRNGPMPTGRTRSLQMNPVYSRCKVRTPLDQCEYIPIQSTDSSLMHSITPSVLKSDISTRRARVRIPTRLGTCGITASEPDPTTPTAFVS